MLIKKKIGNRYFFLLTFRFLFLKSKILIFLNNPPQSKVFITLVESLHFVNCNSFILNSSLVSGLFKFPIFKFLRGRLLVVYTNDYINLIKILSELKILNIVAFCIENYFTNLFNVDLIIKQICEIEKKRYLIFFLIIIQFKFFINKFYLSYNLFITENKSV